MIVLAGALLLPLVFQRDPHDLFRLAKTIALRIEAILIVAVVLASFLLGARLPKLDRRDPWLVLPLGAYGVFVLVTLTSTNYQLSLAALASATATLIVFLATVATARIYGWLLLAVPLVAAMVNVILVIVEETGLWMPFGEVKNIPHHLQCDALIGNPNEVGIYLGAALLAALAASRLNILSVVIALILGAGLIASQTLTAMLALAAGAFCMLAITSWRIAVRAAIAGAVLAVLLFTLSAPLRTRASHVVHWVSRGEYNALFTERFTSFAAAWSMFIDRPLTGVGPGGFAWHYFDEKIVAEQNYPSLRSAWNRGVNFGEVHNDHLQALAEGGILGYAAFVMLLVGLAAISFAIPHDESDPHIRFARRLAITLAVFWAVASLAQFPMESTVVRSLLVHLAALCVGWRR